MVTVYLHLETSWNTEIAGADRACAGGECACKCKERGRQSFCLEVCYKVDAFAVYTHTYTHAHTHTPTTPHQATADHGYLK